MNTISDKSKSLKSNQKLIFDTRLNLIGCPVDPLTLTETMMVVGKIIKTRVPHQHCVVNAGKLVLMHRESELKRIVQSCPLINADGQSVVWALRLMGKNIPERVTGIDLMENLFLVAHKAKYRVYFFGAKEDVLLKVLDHVKKSYPDLVVAGARNGYFKETENEEIVADIRDSNSDILFVAMGSPKKEYWLSAHIDQLNVPFCMGVGGSFDVVAGTAKRAPRWVQSFGMEWFYRFIQEPRRLWRRYLVDNFVFIFLVFASILQTKISLKSMKKKDLEKKEMT